MTEQLESRVAVVETKVDDLEGEMQRTRSRLHDIESDRATIRLLAHQIKELADHATGIAEAAAAKAITAALSQFTAAKDRQSERSWGRWLGVAGAGAMFGGFVVSLVALFTR